MLVKYTVSEFLSAKGSFSSIDNTSWVSFVTTDHSILPKYMLSQWDGSFEHPKQILKRMDKKYLRSILR